MMKKLMSVLLAISMCMAMCVPAFAAEPHEEESTLPPWVEEGETWHPVGNVMPREDFGNCPQGHVPPSGYTYQGYTTGSAVGRFDDIALIIYFGSLATGDPIAISVGGAASTLLFWLHGKQNPNLTYFKYVYTKPGYAPFIHVSYSIDDDGFYQYLTCETYYQI